MLLGMALGYAHSPTAVSVQQVMLDCMPFAEAVQGHSKARGSKAAVSRGPAADAAARGHSTNAASAGAGQCTSC